MARMRPLCTVGRPWRNVTRRAAKRLRVMGKHSSHVLSPVWLTLVKSTPSRRSIALSEADGGSVIRFGSLTFTAIHSLPGTDDPADLKQ